MSRHLVVLRAETAPVLRLRHQRGRKDSLRHVPPLRAVNRPLFGRVVSRSGGVLRPQGRVL